VIEPASAGRSAISVRRGWLGAVVIAALVYAGAAPVISWQEFSNGSENLVVQTVLEMRRGGPWLVPTLQLQDRTQKPPLTAWITASAARPRTVASLWTTDAAARDRAFHRLAWEVRWPGLVSSCLMLLAVCGLGRIVGGWRLGLTAAAMCGTCVLFLRYGKYATTDVQLALWAALANFLLAKALVDRQWWFGCVFGGMALGLALMSKGPVVLLQTVLPLAVFGFSRSRSDRLHGIRTTRTRAALPILAGSAAMLAVGLSWYVYMLTRSPDVISLWWKEVTRVGATANEADPWYNYGTLLPMMLPWAVFFVVGAVAAFKALAARDGNPIVLPLILVVLPVLIMTVASKDRKDRYLLPFAGPAAILAAYGFRELLNEWRTPSTRTRVLVSLHWLLAAMTLALPIAGAVRNGPLKTRTGEPWYSWSLAVPVFLLLASLMAAGVLLQRRRPVALLVTTAVAAFIVHAIGTYGYSRFERGRSDMKVLADAIWAAAPDADVYYGKTGRAPNDLAIYLDRPVPNLKNRPLPERSDRPVVLVVEQDKRESPPAAPEGWIPLARVKRGSDWLHAFIRRPERQ
jgi:4-amino-4-deoxy-L-arabinose transferase-like glycosyltransferase